MNSSRNHHHQANKKSLINPSPAMQGHDNMMEISMASVHTPNGRNGYIMFP